MENISKNNHYVPQSYLKRWASDSGKSKIWAYNILVPDRNYPFWAEKSIKRIAYHQHLYTLRIPQGDSDEIEKWLGQEYESPAQNAIKKVVKGERLSSDDWYKIIRFFALQSVRTPAQFMTRSQMMQEHLPPILDSVMEDLPAAIEAAKKSGDTMPMPPEAYAHFPVRVNTEIKEGEKFGSVQVETADGRALRLWEMRHLLTETAPVLHNHKWIILRPAEGMHWPTSDNPAIRLNYYGQGKYDFGGGWNRKGSELLMPLSPQHLLYTQVGGQPPQRGTRCSTEETVAIRRFIAEHSLRMIFSHIEDSEIPRLKPRVINAEIFSAEKAQWDNWHEKQSESEEYLLNIRKRKVS